jgi:hypothetical protein
MTTAQLAKIPPAGRRLYRIWQQLSEGPLSERELDEAIIRACNMYEGDGAGAMAERSSLLLAGVVTASAGQYQRATEFPVWPDHGPGTEGFNKQLRERSDLEHEEHAERDRAVQAALENGPFGQQRRETIALIRETVEEMFEEKVGELLRGLDREYVEELRERLRRKVAA